MKVTQPHNRIVRADKEVPKSRPAGSIPEETATRLVPVHSLSHIDVKINTFSDADFPEKSGG